MNRTDILNVVIKHLRANVDDLDGKTIDPKGSLVDAGANSLDLIEIVSGVVRETGAKVERTDLAHLKTIDELVDVLERRINGAPTA